MAPNGSKPFPFRLMTGVLITALVVSSVRSAWGAAAAEDVGREITVAALFGWPKDLQVAADAYRKSRPQVHFALLVHEHGKIEGFRRGEVDLLAYVNRFSDYLGGDEIKRFPETFPNPPAETTIAYRTLAVFVHPENSLEKLGRKQLRLLATKRKLTWKDLGREQDGPIWVYVYHTRYAATAILGKPDIGSVLGSYRPPVRMLYEDRILKALAKDRNGIALWYHNRRFAASGLKIVALVPEEGGVPVRPSDAAAVASGRYWLRVPLKIMVHPGAHEEVRRFARWLTTPEAGRAMLEAERRSAVPATYPSPIAHVSLATEGAPAAEPDEVPAAPSPAAPAVPVDGAVAVLPTEPLSMYFLMATAAHHAIYEQTIFEAIEADGRLELVDRTELRRVLQERKLQLLNPQDGPARPLIAADVFVLSYVVTRDTKSCLRVQAVHGPTACLLGQLEVLIDPADPLRFSPPLSRSVARWWSHVVERFVAARSRPIWTLRDVYAAGTEAPDQAAPIRRALETQLSADSRIFFAPRAPLSWTQQEVLMQLTGLSRPQSGRFSPATDFLVEARLPAPGRLQIRLLSGSLVRVASAEFADDNLPQLARKAAAWLDRQVAESMDREPTEVIAEHVAAFAHAEVEREREAIMAELDGLLALSIWNNVRQAQRVIAAARNMIRARGRGEGGT